MSFEIPQGYMDAGDRIGWGKLPVVDPRDVHFYRERILPAKQELARLIDLLHAAGKPVAAEIVKPLEPPKVLIEDMLHCSAVGYYMVIRMCIRAACQRLDMPMPPKPTYEEIIPPTIRERAAA